MGIHGLNKVLGDNCPAAIISNEIKNYFGRKIAIDASMSIYQFLIAVRQDGQLLTNDSGETTRYRIVNLLSHLMGLFYRTIRMVENGIKPCYVFDGKPPVLKSGEVNIDKFSRRTVKVTPEHNNECKELLGLMGIPYVEAPCEAEAQCAALAKAGKVYAAASEDMDTLTFSTPVLLRHLTFSENRKLPINEISLNKIIQGLEISMDQFIDLCILLGCDYCDSIKGIGPHRAVELIKRYGNLEKIIENLDTKKYPIPEDWPYKEARELFKNPDVKDPNEIEIKWETPNVEGLVEFLVVRKGFGEERVRKGADKLVKSFKTKSQGRLDSFFTPCPNQNPSAKHKIGDDKTDAKSKKSKTSTNKSGGRGRPKK
ncbi:9994_t:CDS:2 [Entrophospora sp. SA101]|nr:9994_t:CDS:2 [Entrophospora sp. SA101]CAJ0832347.1 4206_t:CDS:2 [Entrophospora sp. SA101]CAJ0837980.1 10876_t:CDS:2 [Entrophospora sp. SA101]